MNEEKKLTLVEWYIKREREVISKNPRYEGDLINLLKSKPEEFIELIKSRFEGDLIHAGMTLGVIATNYDPDEHAKTVLEAFQKEFLE
jgi:hypothetical protein